MYNKVLYINSYIFKQTMKYILSCVRFYNINTIYDPIKRINVIFKNETSNISLIK